MSVDRHHLLLRNRRLRNGAAMFAVVALVAWVVEFATHLHVNHEAQVSAQGSHVCEMCAAFQAGASTPAAAPSIPKLQPTPVRSVASAPSILQPAGADGSSGRSCASTRSPACFSAAVSARGRHEPPDAYDADDDDSTAAAATVMIVMYTECFMMVPCLTESSPAARRNPLFPGASSRWRAAIIAADIESRRS